MYCTVDDFTDDVVMHLPSLDVPMAQHLVWKAINEMCQRYDIWVISQAEKVRKGKDRIYVVSEENNTYISRVGWVVATDGKPNMQWYYDKSSSEIKLESPVDEDSKFRVTMVLTPARQCNSFPEMFRDSFYDTIVYGALSFAYHMASRPWSNPESAVYYRRKFLGGCSVAKTTIDDGFVKRNRIIRGPNRR